MAPVPTAARGWKRCCNAFATATPWLAQESTAWRVRSATLPNIVHERASCSIAFRGSADDDEFSITNRIWHTKLVNYPVVPPGAKMAPAIQCLLTKATRENGRLHRRLPAGL